MIGHFFDALARSTAEHEASARNNVEPLDLLGGVDSVPLRVERDPRREFRRLGCRHCGHQCDKRVEPVVVPLRDLFPSWRCADSGKRYVGVLCHSQRFEASLFERRLESRWMHCVRCRKEYAAAFRKEIEPRCADERYSRLLLSSLGDDPGMPMSQSEPSMEAIDFFNLK